MTEWFTRWAALRIEDQYPALPDFEDELNEYVREYLDADVSIMGGAMFWMGEGQPAIIVIREPVH